MTDVQETIEVHPITFPPEVLARISPELSLQRHLALGFRPSLRAFDEFRDVQINEDSLSHFNGTDEMKLDTSNNILGSNVLKSGKTFVITSITGGIVEDTSSSINEDDIGEEELREMVNSNDKLSEFATVYPVVEVERGRAGACTDEEMTISQKLHDCLLHSRLISKRALKVKAGVRLTDNEGKTEILYPDEIVANEKESEEESAYAQIAPKKKWSYVLYAKIVVFSRTGPVFDLCWNSLIYALQSTRLPRAFIDERATDLRMTVRTKGRSTTIRETYDLMCDPEKSLDLNINKSNIAYASNFGIIDLDPEAALEQSENEDDEDEDTNMDVDEVKSVFLADLDTEAEETSIRSTISIINDKNGKFKHISLVGGGSKITPDMIKKALILSKERSTDLASKIK
ncbi:hypothetical protein NCAS_0B08510 [Naumovozyma castellii]|uniref:Ribosomal RNA-processing protein 43 n=1 Tax=Naumovozyma castellii TaxID=27288 RepID=G0VAQ9_NAUCA|nr:hypothetical protein NCAS_0B08510 [Naumovozyma castellii CBS 4309]CCC68935.1 hypothetical protein NCAS_0B08510 [Naumovozyma castellii CBS 4309]